MEGSTVSVHRNRLCDEFPPHERDIILSKTSHYSKKLDKNQWWPILRWGGLEWVTYIIAFSWEKDKIKWEWVWVVEIRFIPILWAWRFRGTVELLFLSWIFFLFVQINYVLIVSCLLVCPLLLSFKSKEILKIVEGGLEIEFLINFQFF